MPRNSLMLIWWSLGIGGIETFFLRLAQERTRQKLTTKILLFTPKDRSNQNIINSISRYCEVFYLDCIFNYPKISKATALLSPLNESAIEKFLQDINHIHVACGYHALFANRIIKYAKNQVALTVGFYHSMEFLWKSKRLPYFEVVNRKFVLEFLPKENLLLFSDELIDLYQKANVDLRGAQTFRIGVIQTNNVDEHKIYVKDSILKIVSIGRLVEFKAYNIWMLDVVKALKKKAKVIYDIYGDGPIMVDLQKKIIDLDISDCVKLRGPIEYNEFKKTVLSYDLFVGSGTSIIEASSLGLCCIVGIESMSAPLSYGYFSKSYMFEYNILLQDKKLIPVEELILEFLSKSTDEKNQLSEDHKKAAEAFSISKCAKNFQSLSRCFQKEYKLKLFCFGYTVSYLIFNAMSKLDKGSLLSKRYNSESIIIYQHNH